MPNNKKKTILKNITSNKKTLVKPGYLTNPHLAIWVWY